MAPGANAILRRWRREAALAARARAFICILTNDIKGSELVVFDLLRADDRAMLDRLVSQYADVATGSENTLIEPCFSILAHTAGKQLVTDDNMGTEWRYPLGLESSR